MDMRTIRTLMEINALQSFGAVQTFAEKEHNSSSMFHIMLEQLGGNSSIPDSLTSISTNLLHNRIIQDPLQYMGENAIFKPSSLSNSSALQGISNSLFQADSDYSDIIEKAANQYNLPEKLIAAVIKQESDFKNEVVSQAGAAGLMQLMPGTAKMLGVNDRFDPVQNIMGGAKYLRQMLNRFDDNIQLALAAYNAGPGNVNKYGGIPPFKETEQYVRKVLHYFNN